MRKGTELHPRSDRSPAAGAQLTAWGCLGEDIHQRPPSTQRGPEGSCSVNTMKSHPSAVATGKKIYIKTTKNQAKAHLDLTQGLPCPFLIAALVLPSRYTECLHCSELNHESSHLPAPVSAAAQRTPKDTSRLAAHHQVDQGQLSAPCQGQRSSSGLPGSDFWST